MAEAIGAAAAGAAATALVEYTAPKALVKLSSLKYKYSSWRRCQEYRKFLVWTRSPLSISSALDWGHTCSIALALNDAAKDLASEYTGRQPQCWAFTSRSLAERALGRAIPETDWVSLVELAVALRHEGPLTTSIIGVDQHFFHGFFLRFKDFGALVATEFSEYINSLYLCETALPSLKSPSRISHDVPASLQNFVLSFIAKNRSDLTTYIGRSIQESFDSSHELIEEDNVCSMDLKESEEDEMLWNDLRDATRKAMPAVFLLCQLHTLCFQKTNFKSRCTHEHGSIHARARQVNRCPGIDVGPLDWDFISSRSDSLSSFFEHDFLELNHAWHFWLSNWGKIAEQASAAFPFRTVPDLHGLLLHDMTTGYCATSTMRRHGAKLVDAAGTTVVHAGECAAIVSAAVPSLRIADSAIARLGIRRPIRSTAQEFADYALLRCDLVNRERMSFSHARSDWLQLYTRWDRAPKTLSEWKMQYDWLTDEEVQYFDSIRVVLLRQVGPQRSIRVLKEPGLCCGIFGGFLQDYEGFGSESKEQAIVLDEMLRLMVSVTTVRFKAPDKADEKLIVDAVGTNDNTCEAEPDEDGMYWKQVSDTSRKDIMMVRDVRCRPRCLVGGVSGTFSKDMFVWFE